MRNPQYNLRYFNDKQVKETHVAVQPHSPHSICTHAITPSGILMEPQPNLTQRGSVERATAPRRRALGAPLLYRNKLNVWMDSLSRPDPSCLFPRMHV